MKTALKNARPRRACRPVRRPRNLAAAFRLIAQAVGREQRFQASVAARRRRGGQ